MNFLSKTGLAEVLLLACIVLPATGHSAPATPGVSSASSVYIEDMTSPELQARIDHGQTTVLVPIGGTEQSGPYIELGKHNVRARVIAGRIAEQLGNAVVAPVIAYVPEGAIHPPQGHMKFAGTISVPTAVFEGMLEATARSFKQHGFHDVVFLGDHGGYQADEAQVAKRLNREWAQDPACRVLALLSYYDVTQTDYIKMLKAKGFTDAEIGVHAGLSDAALALAVDPSLVRSAEMAHAPAPTPRDGSRGDPRRATVALGEMGVHHIVETSVAAIREATRPHQNR